MVHRSITMNTYGMDLGPLLAAGETLDVEFKRRLGKDDLYQAVVCMANGTGGLILVGVDDDGTVVGATGTTAALWTQTSWLDASRTASSHR